jgi:hypothetical protein
VHLYVSGEADLEAGPVRLRLRVATDYPWEGRVDIEVEPSRDGAVAALNLRLPGWCDNADVRIDGHSESGAVDEARPGTGYVRLGRAWKRGERVELSFDMPPTRVYAHPGVRMAAGKVALQRGPVVYCLEGVDHDVTPLSRVALPATATIEARHEPGLLGGVTVLEADAVALDENDWNGLYRTRPPQTAPVRLRAVPYFTWDNREAGPMLVWLRETKEREDR